MDMEASSNLKHCMTRASWADSNAARTESSSEVVSGVLHDMVAAGVVEASAIADEKTGRGGEVEGPEVRGAADQRSGSNHADAGHGSAEPAPTGEKSDGEQQEVTVS